jgi:hypothetical protein
MTELSDTPTTVNRVVVVFDICSSTKILERLKQTDNGEAWRNFIIRLKERLLFEGARCEMEPYNFTGDGWVLLFPPLLPTDYVCRFMKDISVAFKSEYHYSIVPLIGSQIDPIGLTFGIDSGELTKLTMNERVEYLGRAINVACRLQASTKLCERPDYKAMFSTNAFNRQGTPKPTVPTEKKIVSLRNILPEQVECVMFETYHDGDDMEAFEAGMRALAGR